jgi:hypothetical protein
MPRLANPLKLRIRLGSLAAGEGSHFRLSTARTVDSRGLPRESEHVTCVRLKCWNSEAKSEQHASFPIDITSQR